MSLNRYDGRRDANEKDIVNALRKAGCRVMPSDTVDLIVQRQNGWTTLLEVKTASGTLTDRQEALMEAGWVIHVVRTSEEALKAVGL